MTAKERWNKWYAKKGKEYQKQYREKNKERLKNVYHRQYLRQGLKRKIWQFNRYSKDRDPNLNEKNLIAKFGPQPRCYLTGQPIDLNDMESYSLDHIVPLSRGGPSSLDNCGLLTMTVNQAKHSLTKNEFIALCGHVLAHCSETDSRQG